MVAGIFLSSCVFSHGNFLPRLVYMMMMCNLYMRPWSRSVCWRLFFVQLGDGACASVLLEFPTLDDWIYRVQYSSWHWKSRIVVSFSLGLGGIKCIRLLVTSVLF